MNVARKAGPSFRACIGSLLLAQTFAVPAQAAQVTEITGTWASKLTTQYSISGFGSPKVSGDGNCTLILRDNFTAPFSCAAFNTSSGQIYSGTVSATLRRNKLNWSLDEAGLNQIRANMTQWLIAKNLKMGRQLFPENVGYEFLRYNYNPIILPDNRDKPAQGTAILKGRATQLINGRYIIKPFTYKIQIKLLARAP